MGELLYREESGAIIGAAIRVYNELGPGFLEAVYQEAMEIELTDQGIPFAAQSELQIYYKGKLLHKRYNPDLICYNRIIVELKALDRLTSLEEAQLFNYLNATHFELGLIFNFGARPQLEWRRRITTELRSKRQMSSNP